MCVCVRVCDQDQLTDKCPGNLGDCERGERGVRVCTQAVGFRLLLPSCPYFVDGLSTLTPI